jgi:hypothetical protein
MVISYSRDVVFLSGSTEHGYLLLELYDLLVQTVDFGSVGEIRYSHL